MKTNRRPPHPATLAAQGLGWTDAATGACADSEAHSSPDRTSKSIGDRW
jgi:hypothetical protein